MRLISSLIAVTALSLCPSLTAVRAQGPTTFTTDSHRLEILTDAFDADYRWIWCGDSFSMIINENRLGWGTLMAWPMGAPYEAVYAPATSTPTFMQVFTLGSVTGSHPYGPASQGHRLMDGVNLNYAQAISSEWFGLPNSGALDYFFNAGYTLGGPTADRFIRLRFNSDSLAASANGPLFGDASQVSFRLFWRLTNNPANSISEFTFDDDSFVGARTTIPLTNASRGRWWKGEAPDGGVGYPHEPSHINAHFQDLPAAKPPQVKPEVGLMSPVGTNLTFGFYGALLRRDGAPGPMFQSISDKSWDYSGLGLNEQSTLLTPKRYTDEQLLNYLDLTTVRRDQRPLFVHHIAVEDLPEEDIILFVKLWVERCKWACEQIGLPEPRFLIIGQFYHWYNFGGLLFTDIEVSVRNNQALLKVAQDDPAVAFVSIFSLTDGVLFEESPESKAWLAANGGTNFTFGNGNGPYDLTQPPYSGQLLDLTRVHIGGTVPAAFFAELIRAEMSRACPANCDMSKDPVTGEPTIDVFDFLCFQNAFASHEPYANCDGSFDPVTRQDTFDVFDFLCFQNRFAAGCN